MEYKEADKDQTLYHPLAHVIINDDMVMINGREYEIIANVKDALDSEMLKEQHMRKVEEALLEAIRAARIAGLSGQELAGMLQTLQRVSDE